MTSLFLTNDNLERLVQLEQVRRFQQIVFTSSYKVFQLGYCSDLPFPLKQSDGAPFGSHIVSLYYP